MTAKTNTAFVSGCVVCLKSMRLCGTVAAVEKCMHQGMRQAKHDLSPPKVMRTRKYHKVTANNPMELVVAQNLVGKPL